MSFDGIFKPSTPGAPLVLPMRAFYAYAPAVERRRAAFYRLMAAEFGWHGWRISTPAVLRNRKPGRDGRQQDLKAGTLKNPAKRDMRASVAEFVQFGTLLDDPCKITANDRTKDEAKNFGDIRRSVARQIAEEYEAVIAGPLKSPDWMKEGHVSAGSGGFAEGVLWSAGTLSLIKKSTPANQYALLEKALFRDVYFWEVPENEDEPIISIQARKRLLEDFRLALDYAALALGFIGQARMTARWEHARMELLLRPAVERAKVER